VHWEVLNRLEDSDVNEVGLLVLTHPVPAPPVGSELEAEWVAETALGFAGEIVLAHDLQVFEVPNHTSS